MIVTTRFDMSSHSLEGNVSQIRLEYLEDGDSLELFNRVWGSVRPGCPSGSEEDKTKELLESIGGLALGIKQMAFFIARKNWSISKFRQYSISDYGKKDNTLKFAKVNN